MNYKLIKNFLMGLAIVTSVIAYSDSAFSCYGSCTVGKDKDCEVQGHPKGTQCIANTDNDALTRPNCCNQPKSVN